MSVRLLLAAALSLAPLAGAARAAEIVRHKGPAASPILAGVTVPAGSEMLILSGMLASPIDATKPAETMDAFGDTKTQTVSVFTKMKAMLESKGYALGDVVKLTVFVAGDPKLGGKMDFTGFNDGYKQFFGTAEQPNIVARSTVQVAALAGPMYLVEIEAIAAKAAK